MHLKYESQSIPDYSAWIRDYASKQSISGITDENAILITMFIETQPTAIRTHHKLMNVSATPICSLKTLYAAAFSISSAFDEFDHPPKSHTNRFRNKRKEVGDKEPASSMDRFKLPRAPPPPRSLLSYL